jgi:acetyl esterase/lipase
MNRAHRESIEAMLRDVPIDAGGELDVQRPLFEQFMRQQPFRDDILLTGAALGGVSLLEVQAGGVEPDATVLLLHGGAFALGSARAGAGLAGLLAVGVTPSRLAFVGESAGGGLLDEGTAALARASAFLQTHLETAA